MARELRASCKVEEQLDLGGSENKTYESMSQAKDPLHLEQVRGPPCKVIYSNWSRSSRSLSISSVVIAVLVHF